MSDLMRSVVDAIIPRGSAWSVAPDEDWDKLYDGIAANWSTVDEFLAELSSTRDPALTAFLADLEKEFGVFTNPALTEQQRRDQLGPVVFNRSFNGGLDNLEDALQAAGFDVQVHSNSPAVDPAIFLDQNFQMVSGGVDSFSGNPEAYSGRTGGELLVNGEIFRTRKEYTAVSGSFFSGDGTVSGEYSDLVRTEITYDIPTDPDDWPLVFFVGGDATRADLGEFVPLGQTSRAWRGMTTGINGDVYAALLGGDIYKQTSGVGNFIALGQTSRSWSGMTTGLNGDVYATVNSGDIYKQTSGVGNFIALGQTSRFWLAMTTGLNGDVYACVASGDIYKQTSGVGNFIALGQTSRFWSGMTTGLNGDVYACVASGDIYKQVGGGELTGIELAEVPSEQEQEFKRIILKFKPIHSWAGLILGFT